MAFGALMPGLAQGALAGLAYGVLLGPVFATSWQAVVRTGRRAGAWAVLGGSYGSDLLLALLGGLGANRLTNWLTRPWLGPLLGWAGGLILMVLGLSLLLATRRAASSKPAPGQSGTRLWRYALLGFWLNTGNPANVLFWGALAAASPEAVQRQAGLTGALLAVLLCCLAKLWLATRLSQRLDQRWTGRLTQITGILLVAGGVIALCRLLSGLA